MTEIIILGTMAAIIGYVITAELRATSVPPRRFEGIEKIVEVR